MRLAKYILLAIVLLGGLNVFGQNEPNVNSYIHHLPLINTASIARNSSFNAALLHKSQWVQFEGAPVFQMLEANMPLDDDNYVAITIQNRSIGIRTNQALALNYTYKARLDNDGYIALSLSPEFRFYNERQSEIQTDFPDDPLYSYADQSFLTGNTRVGAMLYFKKIYFGLSTPALLTNSYNAFSSSSNIRFELSNVQWNVYSSYETLLSRALHFYPSILAKITPGAPIQIDLNAYLTYRKKVGFGLSYQAINSLSAMFDVHYRQEYKIAYAYTHNFSNLSTLTPFGSHEISFIYGIKNKVSNNFNLHKMVKAHRNKLNKNLKKKNGKKKNPVGSKWKRRQPYH